MDPSGPVSQVGRESFWREGHAQQATTVDAQQATTVDAPQATAVDAPLDVRRPALRVSHTPFNTTLINTTVDAPMDVSGVSHTPINTTVDAPMDVTDATMELPLDDAAVDLQLGDADIMAHQVDSGFDGSMDLGDAGCDLQLGGADGMLRPRFLDELAMWCCTNWHRQC